MQKLCLFLLVFITLLSCEEKRSFEIDEVEKRIVLNSIISTDSNWEVDLSYTKSIFDKGEHERISDANVRILNLTSGQSFFLDEKEEGRYARQLNPVEGHEYQLTIKVEDKPLVKAITYVPSVLEVDVISQAVENEEGLSSIEIDIEIVDNPEEENFYVWELIPFVSESIEEEENPIIDPSEEISSVHTLASVTNSNNADTVEKPRSEISDEYTYSFAKSKDGVELNTKTRLLNSPSFISDKDTKEGKIFNRLVLNNKFLSDINLSKIVEINQDSNEEIDDRKPIFQLSVRAVSGELFQYLKTYETYKQSNATSSSIVAPTTIYSNIENGSGIFGGYNLKTFNIY